MTAESADEEISGKILVCSQCPKTFRYRSEKIRHEMSHSPVFECETCSKKFSFISALRRHQKQHKRVGSVKCEQCNRKFRDEELLKRHVSYAHKGTFDCTQCGNSFSSDQALKTHMKIHKPVSERRFKCSHIGCEKSFNFSHHLKHHELTHSNVKSHYCNVCGKGFIQSHHLKTHLRSHDPSECFYCDVSGCNKKFFTAYARKRHMVTHKLKPDSGISSDSNSCDASVSSNKFAEDAILCSACGETVNKSNFTKHSLKCSEIIDISSGIESCSVTAGHFKDENIFDSPRLKAEVPYDKEIADCESALGSCIMGANSCVCAQMTQTSDENYDFIPIGGSVGEKNNNVTIKSNRSIDFTDRYDDGVLNFFDNKENETVLKKANDIVALNNVKYNVEPKIKVSHMCEGCECASTCNIKEPENCNGNIKTKTFTKDESNIKLIGGVVKIKDTFDIDIPIRVNLNKVQAENNIDKNSNEFMLFNTCKDVIGNCIVGGNEGCLCAKMMMDEQQAMAQEIDDITPVPKTESHT